MNLRALPGGGYEMTAYVDRETVDRLHELASAYAAARGQGVDLDVVLAAVLARAAHVSPALADPPAVAGVVGGTPRLAAFSIPWDRRG